MEGISIAPPATPESPRDVEANRLVAGLGWIWVLSVVILLVKKDSAFVQFHARQGFVLFLVHLVLWMVLIILFGQSSWALRQLLNLAYFLVIVVGFAQAVRGKWWQVPILGAVAPNVRF